MKGHGLSGQRVIGVKGHLVIVKMNDPQADFITAIVGCMQHPADRELNLGRNTRALNHVNEVGLMGSKGILGLKRDRFVFSLAHADQGRLDRRQDFAFAQHDLHGPGLSGTIEFRPIHQCAPVMDPYGIAAFCLSDLSSPRLACRT